MSAARRDEQHGDSPELATALDILSRGYWPLAIYPAGTQIVNEKGETTLATGKEPIGREWGKKRPTPAMLRAKFAANPGAGLGLRVGPEAGCIDIENDTGAEGDATLLEMMGGEVLESMGWLANRGGHTLAQFDHRLVKYGKSIIKIGGLEIRIGTVDLAKPKQMQSVCPPTPKADGTPREWNGIEEIASLPESFFAYLDAAFPPVPKNTQPSTIPIYTPKPGQWSAEDRARAYIAKIEPAISGQKGHDKAIYAAVKVGPGFDLPPDRAYAVLDDWSRVCVPPWSEKELQHKVAEAYKVEPRRGWMLEDNREFSDRNRHAKYAQYAKSPDNSQEDVHSASCAYFAYALEQMKSDWEYPRFEERKPVQPFPLDAYPGPLAELCRTGAEASGCPVDFFAVSVLGLVGAAISGSVVLSVKREWYESACLYLAVVALPGSKKSSPLRTLAKALRRIEDRYQADFEIDKQNWEMKAAEAKANKVPADPPPMPRQLVLDDVTMEALIQIHHHNRRGVAIVNDELSSWVASLNAYRQGRGGDKQKWMSANSGSHIQSDRKGKSGESLRVPRPFVTVVGPITPSSIAMMKDGGSDDGWFDRILFSYPDDVPPIGWTNAEIGAEGLEDWSDAIGFLGSREQVRPDGEPSRAFIVDFTPGARALFIEWVNAHAAEQRDPDFPSVLRGPWSKIEGFCARFALILSQLYQAYDPEHGKGRPADVDELAVYNARKLAEYFKDHYRRIRAELYGRTGLLPDTARRMLRWIGSRVRDGGVDDLGHPVAEMFTGRDISNRFRGWSDKDRDEAIHWLLKIGVIREIPPEAKPLHVAGRPKSNAWAINPLYKNRDAENAQYAKCPETGETG